MNDGTGSFIEKETAAVSRSHLIVTCIYAFFALFVAVYSVWGGQKLQQGMNPAFIAQILRYHVEENILGGSDKGMEQAMIDSAPQFLDRFLVAATAQIPELREAATETVLSTLTAELDKLHAQSHESFGMLLDQYDEEIRATLTHLEEPENRAAFKDTLTSIVRMQYEDGVRDEARKVVSQFQGFADDYNRLLLSPEELLTAEERERRYTYLLVLAYLHILAEHDEVRGVMDKMGAAR